MALRIRAEQTPGFLSLVRLLAFGSVFCFGGRKRGSGLLHPGRLIGRRWIVWRLTREVMSMLGLFEDDCKV